MGTYDAQALFVYHLCLVAADKEGHVFSSFGQTAAEIATDGARANYQDSHRRIMSDSGFLPQFAWGFHLAPVAGIPGLKSETPRLAGAGLGTLHDPRRVRTLVRTSRYG
jgi:hypothetical protein